MCLEKIFKSAKNQGFIISLEDAFFRKTTEGVNLTPPPQADLGLTMKAGVQNTLFSKVKNTMLYHGSRAY